jgi:serine/threonine protein phosphatase 1
MKALVIGDIHGCYTEMQRLMDKSELASDEKIIALGDVVDRGPETPDVLKFFRTELRASSLMGFHERKHVRSLRGELQPAISQRISSQQLGENYPEAVAWMEILPLYLELPEAILVHGYLDPGIPLEAQSEQVLCGRMGGDHHLRTNYDKPWYELWDGEKAVIVGEYGLSANGRALHLPGSHLRLGYWMRPWPSIDRTDPPRVSLDLGAKPGKPRVRTPDPLSHGEIHNSR